MSETGAILVMAAILLVTYAVLRGLTVLSNRRAARQSDAVEKRRARKGRGSDKRKEKRRLKGIGKALEASRRDSEKAPGKRRDGFPPLHGAQTAPQPAPAPGLSATPHSPHPYTRPSAPPLHGARVIPRQGAPAPPIAANATGAPSEAEPPLTQASAPAPQRLVQRVFLGTDRAASDHTETGPVFGLDRGEGLTLGHADILLPAAARPLYDEAVPGAGLFTVAASAGDGADDHQFTLQRLTHLSAQSFLNGAGMQARTANRFANAAFVYIHGLNTGLPEALFRTAQIAHDLGFDGPPCAFCWPSDAGSIDPEGDRARAEDSIDALDLFLETVLSIPGVEQVHILAHSTGVGALAQLLSHHGTRVANASSRPFAQLVLAAPEMQAADFQSYAPHLARMAQGVTLYVSSSDRALLAARTPGNPDPRAGDAPAAGPLVAEGIDTVDASAAGTEILSQNRNHYVANRSLLADIGALMRDGMHPPDRRQTDMAEITAQDGIYWRMLH